jgi:uncharacterized protein DUF4115
LLKATGYAALGTLAVAFVALNVLAWSGSLVEEDTPASRNETTVAQPPPAPASTRRSVARPKRRTIARNRQPQPAAKRPSSTTIVLSATRGDCWVEVRDGSPSGEALYTGTLATGASLTFARPKLWVRLGAAANVDLVVNGEPSAVPPGTVELVVPDA